MNSQVCSFRILRQKKKHEKKDRRWWVTVEWTLHQSKCKQLEKTEKKEHRAQSYQCKSPKRWVMWNTAKVQCRQPSRLTKNWTCREFRGLVSKGQWIHDKFGILNFIVKLNPKENLFATFRIVDLPCNSLWFISLETLIIWQSTSKGSALGRFS